MDFGYSARTEELRSRVRRFLDDYIVPAIPQWEREVEAGSRHPAVIEDLKALARSEGLWNLFLPGLRDDEPGTRLSNLEYAPLAEIMGRVFWSSEAFNCSAPDTGNIEILHLFATPAQRATWLAPLLEGTIRSCFAMTEPDVASSDATNIQTSIRRDGDAYVINGRKWFISGAAHPNCRVAIVLGVTDPDAGPHHSRHGRDAAAEVLVGAGAVGRRHARAAGCSRGSPPGFRPSSPPPGAHTPASAACWYARNRPTSNEASPSPTISQSMTTVLGPSGVSLNPRLRMSKS